MAVSLRCADDARHEVRILIHVAESHNRSLVFLFRSRHGPPPASKEAVDALKEVKLDEATLSERALTRVV